MKDWVFAFIMGVCTGVAGWCSLVIFIDFVGGF
jgi:hypothetical protein